MRRYRSESSFFLILAVHVSGFSDLHRSLVLFHPRIHVLHVTTVFTTASLILLAHHILLLVLQLPLALVVKLTNLLQFVGLSHTFLTHYVLGLLLSLLQFLLHSHFPPHSGLHDLLGHSGVDGHESLLLSLKLLLRDGHVLKAVLLFVFSKPLGKLPMVFVAVSTI